MHCADAYVEIFYLKCVQLVKLFVVNHFQNLKILTQALTQQHKHQAWSPQSHMAGGNCFASLVVM